MLMYLVENHVAKTNTAMKLFPASTSLAYRWG